MEYFKIGLMNFGAYGQFKGESDNVFFLFLR